MRRSLFVFSLIFFFFACNTPGNHPHIEIKTELGNIEVELYTDKAPKTTAAFLKNIDEGLYQRCSFYRVLNADNQPSDAPKAELIQGGIWKTGYSKVSKLPMIPHESTKQTGILHTNGTISLARLEPGTGRSEFFICVGDQHGFDFGGENNPDGQGYAAFGKVVKGMNIVNKIYNQNEENQAFDPPIVIMNIVRL